MQDSWSKEEFEKSIVQPRKGITRVVKNGTFDLVDGSCAHEGAIIMDNSQQREVKLGVMIAVHKEVRVLEGVSNPFKVQEGKTKNSGSKKKGQKPSSVVPTRNLAQATGIHETPHGQGLVSPNEQHSLPPSVIQGLLQKEDRGKHKEFPTDDTAEDNQLSYPPATMPLIAAPVEGIGEAFCLGLPFPSHSGLALYGSGQKSSQQIPTQFVCQPTSAHSMEHGQDYSLPPSIIQNPLQGEGNFPVNQLPLDCGQDWYTSFPDASFELVPDFSMSELLKDLETGQWTTTPEGEISLEDVHHLDAQIQIQATCQDNCTSEEFSTSLVSPQSVEEPPALGGDHVLVLIDGEADLGNISFQNSDFHARTGKFKMGVEIENVIEERVQEGITSPFLVSSCQGEDVSHVASPSDTDDEDDNDDEEEDDDAKDTDGNLDPDKMTCEQRLKLVESVGNEIRGLSDELISCLVPWKCKSGSGFFSRKTNHDETCTVCLSAFRNRENIITLPCKHNYHASCITTWLKIDKFLTCAKWFVKHTCPVCKYEVFGPS